MSHFFGLSSACEGINYLCSNGRCRRSLSRLSCMQLVSLPGWLCVIDISACSSSSNPTCSYLFSNLVCVGEIRGIIFVVARVSDSTSIVRVRKMMSSRDMMHGEKGKKNIGLSVENAFQFMSVCPCVRSSSYTLTQEEKEESQS